MPKRTTEALEASIKAKRLRNAHLPRCLHCKVNAAIISKEGYPKRRGLCNKCHNNGNIRRMYPTRASRNGTRNGTRNRTPTSNGGVPAFDWSTRDLDSGFYPCALCIVETVTRPLGLCAECEENNPDWQPRDKSKDESLTLCLKVHKTIKSKEKQLCY